LLKYIKDYRVGSILNTLGATANVIDGSPALTQPKSVWHGIIKLIHDVVRNSTQHKIPVLYGVDSIHGANYIDEGTLFPQPISMAATFNLDIAEKIGHITSVETRAVGIPWNFNPVLDVGRQPLWSRLFETYGEDTYLGVKMGAAYIKGHQGDNDLTKKENTATCLKHFIGI
jgi:beta-glucosidase